MCEVCLMKAEINQANAAALLDLANAAAALSLNVAGSGTAVSNIVERIEKMAEMPREDKAQPTPGTTPEADQKAKDAKLPPQVQAMQKLFRSMGIEAEFINLDDPEQKLH